MNSRAAHGIHLRRRGEIHAPHTPRQLQKTVSCSLPSPSSATLGIGDTIKLAARVIGASDTAVVFRSGDPSIATVSPNGVVRGIRDGTVVILALARADTTQRAPATIRVQAGSGGGLSITSILRSGTSTTVNPASVSGVIDVRVVGSAGSADSLQFLVGNTVVPSCTRRFTGSSPAPLDVICTINTAAYDTVTGAASFPNSAYQITARLLDDGRVTVPASSERLAFTNMNTFHGRLSFTGGQAVDADEQVWNSGGIRLTAVPVVYSGSAGSASVIAARFGGTFRGDTISLNGIDNDPSNGLSVTFPANALPTAPAPGVQGFNTGPAGSIPVITAAVIAGQSLPTPPEGLPFANAEGLRFRLDNEAPLPGKLSLPPSFVGYLGGGYSFATGYAPGDTTLTLPRVPAPSADAPYGVRGVDRVEPTFFAAPASSVQNPASLTQGEMEAVVQRNQVVRTGMDLPATTTASEYVLVGRVADALSGPGSTRISLVRLTNQGEVCVDLDTVVAGCNPVVTTGATATFSVSTQSPGYYMIRAEARDAAGNPAMYTSPVLLVDPADPANAPTVGPIALPATLVSDQPATFSAAAADNVDLKTSALRLVFANDPARATPVTFTLPLERTVSLSAFGVPAVTSAQLRATVDFVRSLQFTTEGVPDTTRSWTTYAAEFRVTDMAGNATLGQTRFAAGAVSASNGLPAGIQSYVAGAVNNQASICTGQVSCGSVPTTVQITAAVQGPSGTFTNPFSRVLFYYTGADGNPLLLSSAATGAQGSDVGGTRTWTVTATLDAAALRDTLPRRGTSMSVFAVGVDAQGDALLSRSYTLAIQ
jgi:hypothetical protein